jgi:hypothetical protein
MKNDRTFGKRHRHRRTRIALLLGGVLLGATMAHAQDNLLPSGDFESQPWKGGPWKGEGTVQLSGESPFAGTGCLRVEGFGADARVQARSEAIAVEPGATYTFDCAFRLLNGKGSMTVRWGQAGVVFSTKKTGTQWETLTEAMTGNDIYGALYPVKLGSAEHEKLSTCSFTIPDGVTQAVVFIQATGDSVLEVDNVTLTKSK